VFVLSNFTHRNTNIEVDYFIIQITNKKIIPKSYKMRYYFQVLVDLNKYKQKHYRLISTVWWCMKNTRAQP